MSNYRNYHLLLRQFRLSKNITQIELSERINEAQSFVSKYESGEQRLDLYEIEKICNALNIQLLDFIKAYIES